MKKKFKLENLGCANCAAKMEERIKKIEGVSSASVNFMMQKLTIDAEDEKFDDVIMRAQQICSSLEPDCKIVR